MKKGLLLFICIFAVFTVSAQQRVVLGLTGDITIGKSSSYTEALLNDAVPILQDADLTIGNLQGCFINNPTQKKASIRKHLDTSYQIPTQYAKVLQKAGFDVLTLANNHSNDYGDEGRQSTIQAIQDANLSFAGYMNGYEYASLERNGMKIAICAFGYGKLVPSINDIEKAVKLIQQLKQTNDIVIISFHGGTEGLQHGHVPFRSERIGRELRGDVYKFAHACIDAGASLVFGHGPQIPRAMELYKNHLIAYSLGNFCTPNKLNYKRALGYAPLLKVELMKNGEILSGRIYSFLQKRNSGPILDPTNKAAKEIQKLTKIDFPKTQLVIQDEGWFSKEITKTVVSKAKNGERVATTVVDTNGEDYNPINMLLSYSRQLLGSRYGRGCSGNGMYDCSGFTKAVYAKIGYKLNPSSRAQYTQGRSVNLDNIRPGDLVFWRGSRRGKSIGHVGMVVEVTGTRSFKFIHAATTSRGVVIDSYPDRNYYSARYVGARRILP